MKAILILNNIKKINKELLSNSYVVGVDKGAYNAYLNNINLDLAIGDFDSTTNEEYKCIEKIAKEVIKLNPIKDETDTAMAIKYLENKFDEIYILGGISGKRIEHFLANVITLCNSPKIKIIDDNYLIECKNTNFIPNFDYRYISFFSLDNDTRLTLKGFKYNLDNYNLKIFDPLCISNEIIDEALVQIHSGKILVIYSKSDNEEL